MYEGTRPEVAAYVPSRLKSLNPAIYLMAIREPTVEDAYRRIKKVADLYGLRVVAPWKSSEKHQAGFVPRVGDYSPAFPNDYRGTDRTGKIVTDFSAQAERPKPQPKRKRRVIGKKSYIAEMVGGVYTRSFGEGKQPKDRAQYYLSDRVWTDSRGKEVK